VTRRNICSSNNRSGGVRPLRHIRPFGMKSASPESIVGLAYSIISLVGLFGPWRIMCWFKSFDLVIILLLLGAKDNLVVSL